MQLRSQTSLILWPSRDRPYSPTKLEAIPDLATSTFTVLIPRVNIGDDPSARFRSVGIHADHFTSIGGPALVRGAQASYDGTDLHGVARAVVF